MRSNNKKLQKKLQQVVASLPMDTAMRLLAVQSELQRAVCRSAFNEQGVSIHTHTHLDGHIIERTVLSMGCVKHCDATPNWDTKAMAKGKRWPR